MNVKHSDSKSLSLVALTSSLLILPLILQSFGPGQAVTKKHWAMEHEKYAQNGATMVTFLMTTFVNCPLLLMLHAAYSHDCMLYRVVDRHLWL
jgi:hypothetical protein